MIRTAEEAEKERKEEEQERIAEEKRMLMLKIEMETLEKTIIGLPDHQVLAKAGETPLLEIKPQRVINSIFSFTGIIVPFFLITCLMLACMVLVISTQSMLVAHVTLPSSALIGIILYLWDWN